MSSARTFLLAPGRPPVEVFLITVFVYSILLLVVARILPGIEVESYGQSLLAGLVLGVLNALVRPVLVILTLPITILTLGLFLLVINAFMLKLSAAIVPGFRVDSFLTALLGSVLLSVFTAGLTLVFG